MAVYTNDLRLKEIANGDESGTWGTSTNLNLKLIGEALSFQTEQVFSSDGDATTTVADGSEDPARGLFYKATSSGNLTATRVLTIAPATISRVMFIENATSGSQSITVRQSAGGSSVTIANGQTKAVYLDGADTNPNVVDAFQDLSIPDLFIDDDLTVGDDLTVSGLATIGETLGVTGVLTANAGVVVDNITIDGTEIDLSSGDLTLDVAGDIILDTDGASVKLKDGGSDFGSLGSSAGLFVAGTACGIRLHSGGTKIFPTNASGAAADGTVDLGAVGGAWNNVIFSGNISHSGSLTVDVAGILTLDSDAGVIDFDDAGTNIGRIENSSSDFKFESRVQDKDILFVGNDGGVGVTALTLDMSAAGAATFNSTITAAGGSANNNDDANILTLNASQHARLLVDTSSTSGHRATLALESNGNETTLSTTGSASSLNVASGDLTLDAAGNIILDADGAVLEFKDGGTSIGTIESGSQNLNIKTAIADKDIRLQGFDGDLSTLVTALNLDMSDAGRATFNDKASFGGAIAVGQSTFTGGSVLADFHGSGSGTGASAAFYNDHNTGGFFVGLAGNTSGNALLFNTADTDIEFYTNNSIAMTLKNSKRLGIGTTAPDAILNVDCGAPGSSDKTLGLFQSQTTRQIGFVWDDSQSTLGVATLTNHALAFHTNGNSSERMRINTDGDIRTSSSDGIASSIGGGGGNVSIRGRTNANGTGILRLRKDGDTGHMVDFFDASNVHVGSISQNGSTTSYNTSSDYRLKENITDLTSATDRLKQLAPKRFNFINNADTTVDGFIAHEVASIVPEAVTGEKDWVDDDGNPIYQGIDQSKLVPLLVATIQELEARIAALESE